MAIIQTNALTKTYGAGATATKALDGISLTIEKGEIFGFLGPNGAGKTTTIKLLLDLIRPTSGQAHLFGQEVVANSLAVRRRVGFLPAELNLWKNYTARRVVQFLARIHGNAPQHIREAERLAEHLQLDLSKRVRDFSTGNKRKLGLVVAMMHKPELLILDEPTSGLDPLLQQAFNEMMREVRDEGRTVFLSSHMLNEVRAICGRVGIIRAGQLKTVDTVDKITQVSFRHVTLTTQQPVTPDWAQTLAGVAGVNDVETRNSHSVTLKLTGDFDPLLRATSGQYVVDMRVTEPTLEEIFLAFYQ